VLQKDSENCRIQLLVVVVFHKLKQMRKKWQWCSWCMCSRITSLITRAYRVQTANLTLYKQYNTTSL